MPRDAELDRIPGGVACRYRPVVDPDVVADDLEHTASAVRDEFIAGPNEDRPEGLATVNGTEPLLGVVGGEGDEVAGLLPLEVDDRDVFAGARVPRSAEPTRDDMVQPDGHRIRTSMSVGFNPAVSVMSWGHAEIAITHGISARSVM